MAQGRDNYEYRSGAPGDRVSARQLSRLLESLPVVAYTCKAGGNFQITFVSQSVEELTGYHPNVFLNDPAFWSKCVHEDDRKDFLEDLQTLQTSDKAQFEYRFRKADGSYIWFSDTRRSIKSSDGSLSHIAGAWQDITSEKKLRQQADYRLQQVIQADKLASLGEVVAGVAHEINNPNSFITYNIPLLDETWQIFQPILKSFATHFPDWQESNMTMEDLCQDMNEIIEAIKIGSDRITRVVENLKEFARPDNSASFKPVQINDIVEKTLLIVGAQLRKCAGTISINLDKNLPEVHGNFQKLEQVFANLLVNAAHAIPQKDTGKIIISSRFLQRLQCVVLDVADNGTGMKPKIMERIFEPFFTNRRRTGGTGLGLSVSYGLIQEHRGIIGVHSKPGIGSRFSVFLPMDASIPLDLRPSILCVDDDEEMLNMLGTLFVEVKDMSFESTSEPEHVLVYLEDHPEVDIVISDIMMPGINGWILLDMIKSRFPLMTVILYTGSQRGIQEKPSNTPDPDFLLEKPFQTVELLNIIYTIDRQRL